jgi:hypothetical protein
MWTDADSDRRAWDLYRQIQAQRASLKTYQDALAFVRVRQMEAAHTIEPVAKKLWEIAERMRGDMDPDWGRR